MRGSRFAYNVRMDFGLGDASGLSGTFTGGVTSMNQRMMSARSPSTIGLILALGISGCGGGGGGGNATTTSTTVKNVVPYAPAIPLDPKAPWHAQFLNGQRVVCGVFGGQPGIYFNNAFKAMPQTIANASGYVPQFMAGTIVYGSFTGGNFSWNTATSAVASTGSKQATAVSPDGNYVAFETAGTASVLHVPANTEVALPVSGITAVSDSGSGVCTLGSSSMAYRFLWNGQISKTPLSGLSGSAAYTVSAANENGLLAGESGGLPCLWLPNATRPSALGIPGGTGGMALSMNTGGGVGGSYASSSTTSNLALLWPEGWRGPNVFVDINGQFPLAGGAVLNGIYAIDPANLDFIGLVTNRDGSQSLQAFAVS